MITNLGMVRPGSTIQIPINTFDSNDPSASVTATDWANTDCHVHKDGSTTQRASSSGETLSINFDSVTGNHILSIDLSDNTTAGFYAAGSRYTVRIEGVTIDGGTVNAWIGMFQIGYADAMLNTTIATLSSQTSFTLTAGPAEASALVGCPVVIHDVASAVQIGHGVISAYAATTKTVTLAAGTTFTAAATDNIAIYPPVNARWGGSVIYSTTRGLAGTALPAAAADAAGGLVISNAGGLDIDAKLATATSALGTASELAKVPKSDGTASWNSTALAAINAQADTALTDYDGPTKAEMDAGHSALPAALEAAILDEGDATALLAAIAAKVEEFLVNEGDATATIAAIATAVWGETTRTLTANTNLNDPTAAAIADAVWDEAKSGHVSAGTFGKSMADVEADTNELQTNQGAWATATGFAVAGDQMDLVNAPNATAVTAIQSGMATGSALSTVNTLVTAVKVITDALGATAAARLNLSAGQIIPFTVSNAVLTPTTTAFAADDITEATADHYNGRIVIWTSGALAGQATSISDYSLVSSEGNFTVVALTEAPANNDTGIIV